MSDDDDDAANELLDEEDDPLPEDLMCVCHASAMQHSSPCHFTLHARQQPHTVPHEAIWPWLLF
jgi:hypothetical protein